MRIAICTLGCKVNQYETQALEQELRRRGHELVGFEEKAEAYVVNTCSVTAVSDKKSRQMLRQARRRNPDAVIAACGCYAQTHPDEVKRLAPDVLVGTNERTKLLDLIERAARDRRPIVNVDDVWQRRAFEVLPAGGMVSRTRAMMKVEDGCVNFCTYCLIPFARGRVRSLPMEEARSQVRFLRAEGYREIVVTGIEISSYGTDFGDGTALIDLLEMLCREAPDVRIRFGSLEPRTITEAFCARAAKLGNLCPHFHLSMQSGCDATLKRMNRKYDTARFYEACTLLRRYFDAHIAQIKAYAEEKLLAIDGVKRIGNGTAPHILAVSLVGYPSANVVTELGNQGICISAGSACHRGQLSHVYQAMGLDKKTAAGVLRVSFGPETAKEEIDALCAALQKHRDTRFPML